MVKVVVVFLTVLWHFFPASCFHEEYRIPNPEIVVYEHGFRVSIPDETGIELFHINGRLIRSVESDEPDSISLGTREQTNKKWIIADNYTKFEIGDRLQYWLYVRKDGVGYRRHFSIFRVSGT